MLHVSFSIQQPLSFVSAGTLIQEDGWIHTERIIDSFEIIIGVEGELYLQQGEEHCIVRPGNILLLLPGVVHKGYKPGGKKTSFFWFHFLPKEHQLLPQSELSDRIWRMSEQTGLGASQECILPLFCPLSPDDKLDILFHQLLHVNNTSYYTSQMQGYVLTALLIQLCQNYLEYYHMEHNAGRSNRSFTQILEWIRTHSGDRLTISRVAKTFNYNENYFSRMFCKKTGVYFTEYVNSLRVNEAKSLLYRTHLSIKEIAYQVGFTDEKYFMKVFKKAEGISPSQYRNAFYHTHQNIR